MIAKLGAAGGLLVGVWLLGVGIDHAGGARLVRGGEHEGVLTPETPIDLDAVVASREVKHTALVSVAVPKVTAIDPGSVHIETPGLSVDDVRATPVLEYRPDAHPKPRSILLLLDNSLSMNMGDGRFPASDPAYRRLDACRLLLDALPNTDRVTLASFPCRRSVGDQYQTRRDDHPYEILASSATPGDISTKLDKLRGEENAFTPLFRAVVDGAKTLGEEPDDRRRILVLLTDGKNQVPDDPITLRDAGAALKGSGIEMYAVGLGGAADNDTLRAMTPNVLRADDAESLTRAFGQIVRQMSREVVQVNLDLVVGRTGQPIPPGRKVEISFRSNGRLYTTKGVTK